MNAIMIRLANADDCRLFWEWANDPVVRAESFSSRSIPWQEHLNWFRSRLNAPDVRLYVACDVETNTPVGQVRFEDIGVTATVGISIDKDYRHQGYGVVALKKACLTLFASTNVTEIRAYIKPDNAPSIRTFRDAGFIMKGLIHVRRHKALLMTLTPSQKSE